MFVSVLNNNTINYSNVFLRLLVYQKVPITCREGLSEYSVDTNGIVYSKRDKPLKPSKNHSGYLILNLRCNNRTVGFQVHRLVAEQFIPNPENKLTVNHKNGDKSNNSVSNLEWATATEQMRHSFDVLGRQVKNVCKVYGKHKITGELVEFNSTIEACKFIKCSRTLVSAVITGRKKSAGGYYWSKIPFVPE